MLSHATNLPGGLAPCTCDAAGEAANASSQMPSAAARPPRSPLWVAFVTKASA